MLLYLVVGISGIFHTYCKQIPIFHPQHKFGISGNVQNFPKDIRIIIS